MADNIKNGTKRILAGVVGFDRNGHGGIQLVNRVRNNVSLYGDSLILATRLDTSYRLGVGGELNFANNLAGRRMLFVRHRAVSGTRCDQIYKTLVDDVADGSLLASGAGTVIFDMGTNCIAQSAGAGFTDVNTATQITAANVVATVLDYVAKFTDLCISLGMKVIYRNTHGATNFTAAMIGALNDLNRKISNLPLNRELYIYETRGVLRNPLTTSETALTFKTGMLYDAVTHPGTLGAYSLGKSSGLLEIIKSIIPPLPAAYSDGSNLYSATNNANDLMSNTAFIGTSGTLGAGGTLGVNAAGGALAGMPTGWTVSRQSGDTTTTFTVNVKEDADGRFVEIVATYGAAAKGVRLYQALGGGGVGASLLGKRLRGFATLELAAGHSNVCHLMTDIEFNSTTNSVNSTSFASGPQGTGAQGGGFPDEAIVFEDATPIFPVPAFDTFGYYTARAQLMSSGAGSATFRVRKPRQEIYTDPLALAA